MPRSLNSKQRQFVAEYCIDHNATQAAIRAGYSAETAGSIGHKLLKKGEIGAAIVVQLNSKNATGIASREDRQRFWSSTMQDTSTPLQSRLKASELLGRSNADFTDKLEHLGGISLEMLVLATPAGK